MTQIEGEFEVVSWAENIPKAAVGKLTKASVTQKFTGH